MTPRRPRPEDGDRPQPQADSGRKVRRSAELGKVIKQHDWNEYDIIARGNHIIEKINGQLMCELTDEDTLARKDGSLHSIHAGQPMKVQFRNIRLKTFAAAGSGPSAGKGPKGGIGASTASGPAASGVGKIKKVVFIAGKPSHGYMQHGHWPGSLLLAKRLNESGLPVHAEVVAQRLARRSQRPGRRRRGGDLRRRRTRASAHGPLEEFDKLMKKGVGLACIHYAVEIPKGEPGEKMLSWIGGYSEVRMVGQSLLAGRVQGVSQPSGRANGH